jgi:hypothetical protein
MRIRKFCPGDQAAIQEIHEEMGLDYKMPDLKARTVKVRTVVEHDGVVIAAAALKIEPETFLWVSQHATPVQKWDAIRLIQRDLVRHAIRLGFDQLVCYLPNCVRFSKRMLRLGWNPCRDEWKPWAYEVKR